MFEQSGITTTPYEDGKTIEPRCRVFQLNKEAKEFGPKPLPISIPNWSGHEFLSDVVGDDILQSIPTIGIKSGSTDYLDLVRPDEFVDLDGKYVCIMKGIDVFKRHFVTFGIKAISVDDPGNETHYIYTLFRRYSENSSIWVLCKSHYSESSGLVVEMSLDCSPTVGKNGRELVKKLFSMYKNGNKGMEGIAEFYDTKIQKYVDRKYVLSFYAPMKKLSL
jgi:hypothetical protein